MIPVPLTKVEEIVKQLEPCMDQSRKLDPFTLQRLKREVQHNLGQYPWAGYLALGMIAVLEWDEEGVNSNFGKAIALHNDAETRCHLASALQLLGKYAEAAVEMKRASDMAPTNLTLLASAISYTQNAGNLSLSRELIHQFNLRSPNNRHRSEILLEEAVGALEKSGTAEDTVVECNRLAFKLLRDNKVPFLASRLEADATEGFLIFCINVAASEDEVDRLDAELGTILFDQVPEFHPGKYSVAYSHGFIAR